MCRIGDGLKSGRLPAILYSDGTEASKAMQRWLDDAGANYAISNTTIEFMRAPVLIVNGIFLSQDDLRDVLEIR